LFPFTHRALPLPDERGQGLIEYALILSLVAIVILVALTMMGSAVNTAYCQVISQFPGAEDPCEEKVTDVVAIKNAEYITGSQELHIDALSNGDYSPAVTLTASPGGVMEAKAHHYHAQYFLPGCPCEVTVTSSVGGSISITVGP
jgi:pilus assembly protein Flp/PilA